MKLINAILLCTFLSSCAISSMDLAIPTIWVQTNDNNKCQMPHQEIKQIKTLQLLLAHQKGSNSSEKPINAHMVDAQGLQLIRTGLAAPTLNDFDSFYYNLNPTNLHLLINATNTLEVPLLRVLCAQKAFPSDIQKQIMPSLINAITGVIMQQNITKKPVLLETNSSSNDSFASIAWSNDKKLIVSTCNSSQPHNCILWKTTTGRKVWSGDQLRLNAKTIGPAAFNSTGKEIAISYEKDRNCFLAIIHAANGYLKEAFPQQFNRLPNCIAWSPDDTKIALGFSAYEEPNFYLIDALTTNTITTQQTSTPSQLLFCPDNKTIVTTYGTNVHWWDILQPEQIKKIRMSCEAIVLYNIKIALDPDGTKIIVGHDSTQLLIMFGLTTNKRMMNLSPQNSKDVAWSNDGTKIATAGYTYGKPSIAILDALTGDELVRFHKDKTHAIAFSPTSKKIVAAGCTYQQPTIYTLLTDEDEKSIAGLKNLNVAQVWLTYELIRKAKNTTHIQNSGLESAVFNTLTESVKKLLTADFN